MKKTLCALVLALALPAALLAYENSPADLIQIPEVVWAAATGGGTWITEIQITDANFTSGGGAQIDAWFYYGTGYRHVVIWTSPSYRASARWTNILATMQSLDSGFTYYGRSGCLWLHTQNSSYLISAAALTTNGNFGKSFPGLQWTDANTANVNRNMMIMDVKFSSNYRTFAGFHNGITGGYSMTCMFAIVGSTWAYLGSTWTESFDSWEFKAFNIFTKAGITTGTYTNCWFYVYPQTSGNYGTGTRGLIGFGSIANNTTNDTYAIIPVQFGPWSSAGLLRPPANPETPETIGSTFM